jgi:hypothetical protein
MRTQTIAFALAVLRSAENKRTMLAGRTPKAEIAGDRRRLRDAAMNDAAARAKASPAAAAGATGETGSRARRRHDLASASADFPPSACGSCAGALLRAAFRYPTMRTIAAWPDGWSFPRRPTALMGF